MRTEKEETRYQKWLATQKKIGSEWNAKLQSCSHDVHVRDKALAQLIADNAYDALHKAEHIADNDQNIFRLQKIYDNAYKNLITIRMKKATWNKNEICKLG